MSSCIVSYMITKLFQFAIIITNVSLGTLVCNGRDQREKNGNQILHTTKLPKICFV